MANTVALLVLVACSLAHNTRSQNCNETTDAFLVISQLPHTAAAYATVQDPTLLCATADLIYFNRTEGRLDYVIHLQGLNGTTKQDITYDYTATDDPAVILLAVNNDTSNLVTSISLYSDFETCSVFRYLDDPERCVLYVSRDYLDDIPPICIEQLECACGPAFQLYDESLCNNTHTST